MKKYSLIISSLFVFFLHSFSQDAKEVLRKADTFCKSIQWGTYEMEVAFKGLMSTDTSIIKYDCKYTKIKEDSISTASFYINRLWNNKYSTAYIYSGQDFIYLFAKDSTGNILNKDIWPAETKRAIKEAELYRPLTGRTKPVFFYDEDFDDIENEFILDKDVILNDIECYHVRVINGGKSNASGLAVNQVAFEFWIRKDNYLPIQYASIINMMNGSVPMQQYAKYSLTNYSINPSFSKNIYDIADAPKYFRLKNYEPYQRKAQLANGSKAPELAGKTKDGTKIKLKDYQGKVVLIDFFYMACAPCILSFPHIKEIYQKYADSGLMVLGVNPIDKKKDQLKMFFEKYKIEHPVIFPDDTETVSNYIVQGYPCFYLVDKKGNIAFSLAGFGEGVEKLIEENIKTLLHSQ